MSNKKVAVILSGCGVYDGAEIHESVAALYALENHNLEAVCVAPDVEQMHVINHLAGQPAEGEKRNVLVESARIARGNIKALTPGIVDEVDAVMLPGGFGAAKNLSSYAVDGPDMQVNPAVAETLKKANQSGKPIVALCIAPVILSALFKDNSPELTLGADTEHSQNLEKMGSKHQVTDHEEVVVDETLKLITAPCYMLDASVGQIIRGTEAAVVKLEQML